MRIMFVGDINLGEYYTSLGHGPRSYLENGDVFAEVKSVFGQADLVVGNLEAPLTTHDYDPNEPESTVLRGDPVRAGVLASAGFKVLQLANNHTVQHGKDGFTETVDALAASGIQAVGLNGQDVHVLELKGESVGFMAASDVPDNTDVEQDSYQRLDALFVEKAKNAVSKVDHLFVMLHWGLESSTSPLDYQRSLIEELSAAGVRGVIGSHPHLFYEVWHDGDLVAAPSLGNFVFDLGWDRRLLQTGILDVAIEKSVLTSKIHPVWISQNGCVPRLSGPPVAVSPQVRLYDLGEDMSGEQVRKLRYFFRNLFKGNTRLKLKFFARKVLPSLRASAMESRHG